MDQLQCYLAFTMIILDPIALADLEGGYGGCNGEVRVWSPPPASV